MTDALERAQTSSDPVAEAVDWPKVQRWGAYAGLTLVFIAATGMKRARISPEISFTWWGPPEIRHRLGTVHRVRAWSSTI